MIFINSKTSRTAVKNKRQRIREKLEKLRQEEAELAKIEKELEDAAKMKACKVIKLTPEQLMNLSDVAWEELEPILRKLKEQKKRMKEEQIRHEREEA